MLNLKHTWKKNSFSSKKMQRYIDAVNSNRTSADDRFNFQRFKPKWFAPGSVAVMIGKKGTGKTTVMMDLCYSLRHCPEVTLFQKTYDTNPAFWDVVPGLFSYNVWRTDVVQKIIDRQKKENKKREREGRPPRYHTLVIDDLACDETFLKDKLLAELFMNARWLKLNIIITLQYALKLTPDLRDNIDWVFMLKEILPGNRRRLYDHFCGQFDTPKEFYSVFEKMTENRSCMVLNTTGLSNKISDNYFHFKATPRNFHENPSLPKWQMGSRAYWAFHYRFFDKHWDSSQDSEQDSGVLVIEKTSKFMQLRGGKFGKK